MSYLDALNHPKWYGKREEVFRKRGRACEVCGETKKLQVHHKSYKIDIATNHYFSPWEYPLSNFSVLCNNCHEEAHKHFKPAVYRVHRSTIKNRIEAMKDKFAKFFTKESKDLEKVDNRFKGSRLSSNIGELFNIEDNDDIHGYGFKFSQTHEGSEHIYWMCLSRVYSNAINKSINSGNNYKSEIVEAKNSLALDIEKVDGELFEEKSKLQNVESKIKKINQEILESRASENVEDGDKFYIRFYSAIIFFLVVFMFIFYSSAMFNAFFVNVTEFLVEERSFGTIINLEAIPYLWDKGLISFIIGFSAIFSGFAMPVGFAAAIHRILFEDKKYLGGGIIVLLTLAFDSLLAFMIEKNKYQGEYLRGLVSEEFTVKLALIEPQFYLILFIGFGTFIMLSGLFYFYSLEKDKLDPIKQQKHFQEKVINVKKGEIEGLNNDKTELEQLLIKKETERKLLVEELNQLESKMKESRVDLNFVQNYVLEFTIGYSAFINQNFTKIHSKEKTSKLYEMVNEFFENNNLPTIKTNVLGAE